MTKYVQFNECTDSTDADTETRDFGEEMDEDMSEMDREMDSYYERDIPSPNGQTALHAAAMNGHVEVVKLLLAHKDIDPNIQDDDGKTALHLAAENGHEEVVEQFMLMCTS